MRIVLEKYEFEDSMKEQASRMIENNRHNSLTTCYYLTLKRFIRSGGKSIADITRYNPSKIEQIIQEELAKHQQAAGGPSDLAKPLSLVKDAQPQVASQDVLGSDQPGIVVQVQGKKGIAKGKQ